MYKTTGCKNEGKVAIMFGGLKKKLQEAISRATAPKKEEIAEEIRRQEAEELRKEIRAEVQELEAREKETEEFMETGEEKPSKKLEALAGDIEAQAEKGEIILEKVGKQLGEGDAGVEKTAREEFERISREAGKPEGAEETGMEPSEAAGKEREKSGLLGMFRRKEKKPAPQGPVPEEEKRSFISGIARKIAEKTLTGSDIDSLIGGLQTALLENDAALEVAEQICMDVRKDLVGKSVKRGEVEKFVKASLREAMLAAMKQEGIDIDAMIRQKDGPLSVMFLGFNGTGKTTSLCKLAARFMKYSPVIAAGDTFRAASIEQLEEHGSRLGVKIIKHAYGADSAAVIFDARKHAAASGSKLVLADTAGRSHSNVNLMDELRKVVRVNRPDLKILVLDSVTGNDIYEQARLFDEAVGVDGIILTKADVYDKGGAALSAAHTIRKPIIFMGTGQEYGDLKEFVPEEVVESLLGE